MHLLKQIILFIGLFILSNSLFGQRKLPAAEIKTLDGNTVNIQDYANNGKITLISFWATWCSPCKRELDAIADFYEEWQEKYDMELVAISIDTRRNLAKVPAIVSTKGWEYIILSDENQTLQQSLGFQTIPQTYILDKEGNIVYDHNGYVEGDEYHLEEIFDELVKK